jgi:tRNA(Ile2)-agmatinylcytidine synthase
VTVIALDDTDSRERGMCTTYAAATLADRLADGGATVDRTLLVRLDPSVPHKTRGNAALAVHCDADPGRASDRLEDVLAMAETDDPATNPGAVVADCAPTAVPDSVADFAKRAVREHCDLEVARELIGAAGLNSLAHGDGRGLIGALAAAGAWRAFDEWTAECISYRERDRWGTERDVDEHSVRVAADEAYPAAWDTVDRVEEYAVCVPKTPCPILHGIRGEDPDVVCEVAGSIESEPVARRHTFRTNQGTDAHLRAASLDDVLAAAGTGDRAGAYRVTADVVDAPETRAGGHVFLAIGDGDARLPCTAFEPTKRFRDRVRALRVGDRITACGEVRAGTLKLEKFALRERVERAETTPTCPDCGRSMESAGRDQGYRCRDCGTDADGPASVALDRDLEVGWYEVPPVARRHVAKPLVRGGFDAPVHPER